MLRGWFQSKRSRVQKVLLPRRLVDGDLDRLVDGHQQGRAGARHAR